MPFRSSRTINGNGKIVDAEVDVKSKDSSYILMPGDKLTFGINLSNKFDPSTLNGKDIVLINGDVKFKLLGRYLQNEEIIDIESKRYFTNKNVKKVGVLDSLPTDFVMNRVSCSTGKYYDMNGIAKAHPDPISSYKTYSGLLKTFINKTKAYNVKNIRQFIASNLINEEAVSSEDFYNFHYFETLDAKGYYHFVANNKFSYYSEETSSNVVKKIFRSNFYTIKTDNYLSYNTNGDSSLSQTYFTE